MRLALVVGLAWLAGCASAAVRPPPAVSAGPAWERLGEGRQAAFSGAEDAAAWFGQATVAFEHGDSEAAMNGYLKVLEAAAGKGGAPLARALSEAATARLAPLMEDLAQRGPAEERLLALDRTGFSWAVQVELADLATAIARRRNDAALLGRQAARAGCLRSATSYGLVGRLPHLDLEPGSSPAGGATPPEGGPPMAVAASGCRLLLPAVAGHPGVRLLRGTIEVAAGAHDLAVVYSGPALLRVDGGPWQRHGSPDRPTPRASAFRMTLGSGRHTVDLRLGTFGGASEVSVLAVPAAAPLPAIAEGPLADLVAVLSAGLRGDADAALEQAGRLGARRRFAPGLAAAARVALHDPTRPANIARDGARSLFRQALRLDQGLARPWRELAQLELVEDRPREASEAAERALRAAPQFWPAALTLSEALRARGFERHADRALERAAGDDGRCAAVEVALRRARELGKQADEDALSARLGRCDAQADLLLDRLRTRGDLPALESALRARLATSSDPAWARAELAQVLMARGRTAAAVGELTALVAVTPRDPTLRVRLADALVASGAPERARATLTEALRLFASRPEVRQAARALGIPLPLESLRVDGREVIRAFERGGRRYDAPAVMVLDRSVERILPDGARLILTHDIVRVQSKDGIERWGEVNVPDGADVLTLRTIKPDGSLHEPEEIVGKSSVSAPDLAVGDYVEWETMEVREPADAFAPGFLGERFYFQSPEAPLDRSEYLLVAPPELVVAQDRRAGAPAAVEERGPDGTRLLRFVAREVPQLFTERGAVPPVEWMPSVRLSSGVSLASWSRFLADELYGVARSSPSLRKAAQEIAASAAGNRQRLPELLTTWVNGHVEPESDPLEPASFSLARGRGNRAAVLLALARALGVPAELGFARPLTTAAPDAPAVTQELDDFADLLVRLPGDRFYDPRLRRAPFGYLPPTLAGAPVLMIGAAAAPVRAATSAEDSRRVVLDARLGADGQASATVTEDLRGWPAIEWVEMIDRAGQDRTKLRQDFEQHFLSQNFPGAILGELQVSLDDGGAGGAHVRYTFTHPELAQRDEGVLKLSPTFFRAQPGHRYAAEVRRRTTLQLGFETPLELEARLTLPPGAHLIDAGDSGEVAAGPGGALRFVEVRKAQGAEVLLRREARLPMIRVSPADYPVVAAQLRRVDPLEQSEIRLEVPAAPAAAGPEPGVRSAQRGLGRARRDPTVH
jgi:tetratricopeptide (TPR) repeat protein